MRDLILYTAFVLFSGLSFAHADSSPLLLKGSVDGYQTTNYDDKLDFGLVIPTLSKSEILDFSMSSVLSTKTDVVRAAGQSIEVPSNLSLPSQKERYFITVRLKKPAFTLPIHSSELPENVAVLEGSIPFRDTVDTLRAGNPLFSVINTFTFKSYTVSPVGDLESELQITAGANQIEGEDTRFALPFDTDEDYLSMGLNLKPHINDSGLMTYFPINIKTVDRPQNLTSVGDDNVPVIVTIPKSIFDGGAEEAGKKAFPFSLVWNESEPITMLPLGKDFTALTNDNDEYSLSIDRNALNEFTVLNFKFTAFGANGEILKEEILASNSTNVSWNEDDFNAVRVRLDVFAIDPDPIVESLNRLFVFKQNLAREAKYVSRHEQDLQ